MCSSDLSLRAQLIGTWTVVSVDTVAAGGARTPTYGPNPRGTVMFDARGNYALILAKVGMPKFASDNRTQGSAEENRAVVQGTLAHFGTYKVDERQRTLNFHIVGSTFPNWEGNDQLRPLSITGNVAKWTTPEASGGGVAELVIRRQR